MLHHQSTSKLVCVCVCVCVSLPTTPKQISPKSGKNTHPIHEVSRYSPLCRTCISTFYSCQQLLHAFSQAAGSLVFTLQVGIMTKDTHMSAWSHFPPDVSSPTVPTGGSVGCCEHPPGPSCQHVVVALLHFHFKHMWLIIPPHDTDMWDMAYDLAQTRDNDTLWCQRNLAYISSTDQQWLLRAVQKKLCSIGQT